jgi:CheY-like chemotaxis protein
MVDIEIMPVRFLIADDYRAHQRLLANIILLLGGEWQVADDGRMALQMAQRQTFDVILMDLQMPNLGGVAAADHLIELWTSRPQRPRIVAMTGDNSEERRMLCRAIGMDGFIPKPFDVGRLSETLQQVIIRGHCWEEGPAARLLNRSALHEAVMAGDHAAGMDRFESWVETTPAALREFMDEHNPERLEELRAASSAFGFVRLDASLALLHESRRASAVWLVETARDFRVSLAAAREALRESSTWMMAA